MNNTSRDIDRVNKHVMIKNIGGVFLGWRWLAGQGDNTLSPTQRHIFCACSTGYLGSTWAHQAATGNIYFFAKEGQVHLSIPMEEVRLL